MTRGSRIAHSVALMFVAVAALGAEPPGEEKLPAEVEATKPHEDLQQRELRQRDREQPWERRWNRLMQGRVDDHGRSPAEALRQAREYDKTMPSAAGPESTYRASVNQSVPGDAWRSVGPSPIVGDRNDMSGRIRSLVVVDSYNLYVGSAAGGVWKWNHNPIEQTTTWTPLSDFEDSLAIGSLAMDPQDSQILYAGTGEIGNGGSSYYGAGVLKSIDGGATWTLKGQAEFDLAWGGQRIPKIVLDPSTVSQPKTQRVVYLAATNGFWRSGDAGENWTRIRTGNFTDVVIDPTNPNRVFAGESGQGIWKYVHSAGPATLLSDIGGQLPTQRFARINLAMVEDPMGGFPILFASMQDTYYGQDLKGIWRTNDYSASASWTRVTGHPRQFADGTFANANMVETESNDTTATADIVPENWSVGGSISTSSDADYFRFTLSGRDSFNAEIMADRAGSGLHPKISMLNSSGSPFIADGQPYVKNGGLKKTDGTASKDSRMLTGWKTIPAGTYYLKVESDDGTTGNYQLSILGIDLACQCAYDQALTVDPDDPSVIYMGLISFFRSTNGGASWTEIQDHGGSNWVHQDIQTVAVHPTDSNTIYLGSDGGLWRSSDRGNNWTSLNTEGLAITQPFLASIHPTDPGFILIGNQDTGSSKLESGTWTEIYGGDGASSVVVASNEYYYSAQRSAIRKVDPVLGDISATNGLQRAGAAFIAPLVLHPTNSQTLLAGGGENGTTHRVYRTTSGGASWSSDSPAFNRHVLAIAFAPSNPSIYYVGTNNPNPEVWRASNNGGTNAGNWNQISWPGIPGRQITDIAVAGTDPNRVYVSFKGFGAGHVFRSTNGGTTWQDISRAPHSNPGQPQGISVTPLPNIPVEAMVVDPAYRDTIFVGTDLGVYRTTDGGLNWAKFSYKLPNTGVRDLVLSTTSGGTGRLLAATHGRGVWELFVSNDSCANADVITDGNYVGTTRSAGAEGGASCGSTAASPTVWYEYTATCDGNLNVSTCGSTYDTVVSIHGSGCPGDQGNEFDCSDDCTQSGCGGQASCASAQVTQGNTYLIRVSGFAGASGDFLMSVECDVPNDTCGQPITLSAPVTQPGSTRGAATAVAPVCDGFDVTAPGVWYTVIGTGNTMTASTCNGTTYDSKLSVYCSGCSTQTCIGANDDFCSVQSQVSWCAAPGSTYQLLVHGYLQNEGAFNLEISDNGTSCGPFYLSCFPHNDQCVQAEPLTNFPVTGDNTDATSSPAPSCRATAADVWYEYEPTCHGFAEIGTCDSTGSLPDTVIAVYDACGGNELACNDDACGLYSQVTLPVSPEDSLRIMVGDYFGDSVVHEGTFTADTDFIVTPLDLPWPGLYVGDGDGFLEDHLLRVDRDDESYVDVGSLGVGGLSGMTFVPGLGLLYGINDVIDADEIVTIDPSTGAATVFASTGFVSLRALAYVPGDRRLYGYDLATAQLIDIDPFAGTGTAVGAVGYTGIEGMAYDPVSDRLFGADTVTGQLIEIDRSTGSGTAIGSFGGGIADIRGLAFDVHAGELLGVHALSGVNGKFVRIDTTTGAAAPFGLEFSAMGPDALALIPHLPEGTVGVAYDETLPAQGGCPAYGFANASGLPPGLALDSSGKISGTPTASGRFIITADMGDHDISTPSKAVSFPLTVRPANDDCFESTVVGDGVYPFSNIGASTDGPDEPAVCDFSGDTNVGADIWYCYVAECTGDLVVSTCGSGYDTKVAVYDGCECSAGQSAYVCNDDSCATQSELVASVVAGQAYSVRVGGYAGSTGDGFLSLTCVGDPAGACCTGTACSYVTAAQCTAGGGAYFGDGTDCTVDTDGEGILDYCDGCPADPYKYEPGVCGCGTPDLDLDVDAIPDCVDDDVDGDGVLDIEDSDPVDRFQCGDFDGDGCDDCMTGTLDPANDGVDADGDGWCDVGDCDDVAPGAYHVPGEVDQLNVEDGGLLDWNPPFATGGTGIRYDLLRSTDPADFGSATCVESDDFDLVATDPAPPPANTVFFYLARGDNDCAGEGPLGFDSFGAPRSGRSCP